MKVILILSSIIVPICMLLLSRQYHLFRLIFNISALLSTIIFGNIISTSIYQILKDQTVFMTNIHAILLNPFFLATGAYLGIYMIYRIGLLIKTNLS